MNALISLIFTLGVIGAVVGWCALVIAYPAVTLVITIFLAIWLAFYLLIA